jgi:hypothetical protein
MSLYHYVNGALVEMTPEQEAAVPIDWPLRAVDDKLVPLTQAEVDDLAARSAAHEAEAPVRAAVAARQVQDETERVAVKGETGPAWLDMTPDQAAQWVNDTYQNRITAGDLPPQAILFILRRLVRILLIVARRSLR